MHRHTFPSIHELNDLHKTLADITSSTAGAADKAGLRLLAVVAEFERELAAERNKGEKTGGHVPFGFALADDGRTLVERDDEQAIIRMIADLRAGGMSYRAIADELKRRNIDTKTGGEA